MRVVMLIVNPSDVPMYHLLNAIIAPRPIAWVSTVAEDGTFNVAPHSYTTVFSPDPPIVGFVSVGHKDTLRNARSTGDFVYNVAGEALGERLNLTAADFPPDISEFDWAGLTPAPSDLVRSPRVGEASVAMECRVVEIHPIAATRNTLVLGEIVRVHLAEAIVVDGRVRPELLRPLGRLAGSGFSRLGELISMERPTYQGLLAAGKTPITSRGEEG